jgi:hypothetical protein
MVFKKGLFGDDDAGYRPYWVKRYLCKRTGRTFSIYPSFSHFHKQFLLTFVIERLTAIIEDGRSVYS